MTASSASFDQSHLETESGGLKGQVIEVASTRSLQTLAEGEVRIGVDTLVDVDETSVKAASAAAGNRYLVVGSADNKTVAIDGYCSKGE